MQKYVNVLKLKKKTNKECFGVERLALFWKSVGGGLFYRGLGKKSCCNTSCNTSCNPWRPNYSLGRPRRGVIKMEKYDVTEKR